MGIFDKLKNIPGIGVPSPESSPRQTTEDSPIKQAAKGIGYDIQVRLGNELIKGWQSIANPVKNEPKAPKKEPKPPGKTKKLLKNIAKEGLNKMLTKKTSPTSQELSLMSDIVEGEFRILEEDKNA
jgi:hypothetical protein